MQLSIVERARIGWAGARYAVWLDLHHVPGRVRKDMTGSLKANLTDAARSVGVTEALENVGSLRRLARSEAHDGQLRSPWLAAFAAAFTTFVTATMAFFLLALYYMEGVWDSGITEPVSGGLFPFVGSEVVVENNGAAGFAFELMPGYLPLVLAVVVFIAVARPWRVFRRSAATALV